MLKSNIIQAGLWLFWSNLYMMTTMCTILSLSLFLSFFLSFEQLSPNPIPEILFHSTIPSAPILPNQVGAML